MNSNLANTSACEQTKVHPLDQATFREAMSRIAAAVHVVTTDGPAGRFGATVSAVCSVSDAPASVLVCVNRSSRVHSAILENKVFCINTLAIDHEDISDVFAGRGNLSMDDRFRHTAWTPMSTGCPALEDALLSVDCEVQSITEMGSHSVIIGTVADLRMNEPGSSLLYVRRGYHALHG
ncbi:flavin reductase family protein [Labrenzia sp. CE80]|uniref:flavin reductase family protein n=1 Tax=Labrenzia sp. CE80 TaxID=1788986 RepID=UPI00256FC99C|nr:flavin reductase family protein [Labrenzia sp. CE80]